jgi:dihydrofolate synthase/folylpolyglutamate synthase
MNYTEALSFIHGIARFGSKPGLSRVQALLERLGNPQKELRFIHVAGTKGKGSTCAMISNILTQAGYKTGLYISPYVLDFRERIQIDGEMIPEKALAEHAGAVKAHWDILDRTGDTPSEFEVVVAIAFEYFLRESCDAVVLEVGMGGRLDATNIIDAPLCSVITSLGLDHTEYLGDTIEKIAYEKCGIIKPGGVTVSAYGQPAGAAQVIAEACRERGNRLIIPAEPEIISADIFGSKIRYRELECSLPLGGAHQAKNAAVAIDAALSLRESGCRIAAADIVAGIAGVKFPSRLEALSREPLFLLDGAHNAMSAEALAESLTLLGKMPIHAVAGIMADKDARAVLEAVLPHCESLICVTPQNPRAMRAERLAELAKSYIQDVTAAESIEAALQEAIKRAGQAGAVLVFGSLYLASEVRPIAKKLLG